MEEKFNKDISYEEVMMIDVLKRSFMEEAQKKYDRVTITH